MQCDKSVIILGELKNEAFQEWPALHPDQGEQLQWYKRMIDDGFGLWTGFFEKWMLFLHVFNFFFKGLKILNQLYLFYLHSPLYLSLIFFIFSSIQNYSFLARQVLIIEIIISKTALTDVVLQLFGGT